LQSFPNDFSTVRLTVAQVGAVEGIALHSERLPLTHVAFSNVATFFAHPHLKHLATYTVLSSANAAATSGIKSITN